MEGTLSSMALDSISIMANVRWNMYNSLLYQFRESFGWIKTVQSKNLCGLSVPVVNLIGGFIISSLTNVFIITLYVDCLHQMLKYYVYNNSSRDDTKSLKTCAVKFNYI